MDYTIYNLILRRGCGGKSCTNHMVWFCWLWVFILLLFYDEKESGEKNHVRDQTLLPQDRYMSSKLEDKIRKFGYPKFFHFQSSFSHLLPRQQRRRKKKGGYPSSIARMAFPHLKEKGSFSLEGIKTLEIISQVPNSW